MIYQSDVSRILIVGTGSMGQRHFEIASRLFPKSEIAFFSGSGNRSNSSKTFTSKSEVEAFRPEISVIANQASLHLEMATLLLNLGSHLLIEKPISHNFDGISELIELKDKRNLKVLVGYNLRYLRSFKYFQLLLRNQSVGRVLDVRIEVGQSLDSWRPGRDYKNTASAKRISGGGVLRELSHEFDYLIEFFGFPLWVFASLGKVSELEIDVEDIAHIILGMRNEQGTEFMATMSLDFIRQDKRRSCTVIGVSGTLEWNLLTGEIVRRALYSPEPEILQAAQDSLSDTYIAEWEDLINSIDSDLESVNSLENSMSTMELISGCEKSHYLASKVKLTEVTGESA